MTVERNVKGLLGTKLGMTQMWDENNRVVPVTVVAASTNVVTQVRKPESDGYNAIQVGFGEIDSARSPSPRRASSRRPGSPPAATSSRSAPRTPASYTVGQELAGRDLRGGRRRRRHRHQKGKGFAGIMKRHGFHGVGASHGAHRNHRKPGSIGACATPGRVFKGVRMSGRMGSDTVTTQNVVVHAVDAEKGLILLKGAVPGAKGGLVVLRSAAKRAQKEA